MIGRDELAKLLDETLRRASAAPPSDVLRYGIGLTSGTSGNPILLSVREYFADSPQLLSGPERMLCLRGSINTALNNVAFTRLRARTAPARMLFLDPAAISAETGILVGDFEPDGISGFPYAVSILADSLSAETRNRVTWIEFAGEGLPVALSNKLREAFPNAIIHMIYSASEISGIGHSCSHLDPNRYHPFPGVTIEVNEPDELGEGELLVSKTIAFGIPVHQYRIGDFGRMIPGTCACGEAVTFEVLGRNGRDYIKLAGALLRRDLFDRAALSCKDVLDDYRAEAMLQNDGSQKGKVIIHAYHAGGIDNEGLEKIHDAFLGVPVTPTRTLGALVEAGLFLPVEVIPEKQAFPEERKVAKILLRIA